MPCLYAFINNSPAEVTDSNNQVNEALDSKSAVGKVYQTLKRYKIQPVLWNQKNRVQKELMD